jgi:tripeptidyl-peptidase I
MALGARGISVLFASGDGGVRGGHDDSSQCTNNTFIPVFPASCPFVTSIGSTLGVQPERAINFTGGGFSNVFSRPAYQDKAVASFLSTIPSNFAGVFNRTGRGYPDASFQGWNFEIVVGGDTGLVGGTSASSPGTASVIATINDRLLAVGRPPLGFLNPFLYGIGSAGFTDITIGKNVGFTCNDTAVRLLGYFHSGCRIDMNCLLSGRLFCSERLGSADWVGNTGILEVGSTGVLA